MIAQLVPEAVNELASEHQLTFPVLGLAIELALLTKRESGVVPIGTDTDLAIHLHYGAQSGRRTLRGHLRALEDAGLVHRERRGGHPTTLNAGALHAKLCPPAPTRGPRRFVQINVDVFDDLCTGLDPGTQRRRCEPLRPLARFGLSQLLLMADPGTARCPLVVVHRHWKRHPGFSSKMRSGVLADLEQAGLIDVAEDTIDVAAYDLIVLAIDDGVSLGD